MTRLADTHRQLVVWTLLPTVLVLNLVNTRRLVPGLGWPVTVESVGFVLLAGFSLPVLFARWGSLPRLARLALVAAVALFGYALASAWLTPVPVVQKVTVARSFLVAPTVTALAALLAAWGVVLATDASQRLIWLWRASVVLLVTTCVSWPRLVAHNGSARLATAMGGASTIHVVLLLCTAIFVAAAVSGHRRRWSWALTGVSLLFLLATGSRAGLVSLVAATAITVVWALHQGTGRRARRLLVGAIAAAVVMLTVLVAVVPELRRLLTFGDPFRQRNFDTGWAAVTESATRVLFGVGSGRVWPWLAFEAGPLKIGWRGNVRTAFGPSLTNPHSTFAGVFVELGLVGLLLMLVVVAALAVRLLQLWGRREDALPLALTLALVATLPAFVVDYYWFKSFSVSWWWWLALAVSLTTPRSDQSPPAGRVPARSADREAASLGRDEQ